VAANLPTPVPANATFTTNAAFVAASVMPALTTTATGSLLVAVVAAATSDTTASTASASDSTIAAAANVATPSAYQKCKAQCNPKKSRGDRCAGLSDVTTSAAVASASKVAKFVLNIANDITPSADRKRKVSTAVAATARLPLLLPPMLLSLALLMLRTVVFNMLK
jgi:hypothetical protein